MSRIGLISTRRIYSGAVSLRKDRFSLDGRVIEKEVVEHQPSVGILPIIGTDSVLLVTQYRRAADKSLLEIPAGKIEKGETPRQAASREMGEEIGFSGQLRPLVKWFLAPGYDTEFMHVFVATNLKKNIKKGILDDDEDIRVRRMKLNEALKKCFTGEIQDCKTVGTLLAYQHTLLMRQARKS